MSEKNNTIIDPMAINNIAKLARLKISDDEANYFGEQLSHVLSHFEQISKIETNQVEPMITPVEIEFVLRADEVSSEISTEEITKNAPEKAGMLFKVPPVV